ncbi:NXPE family member 4-like [Branchiostoma floridae]|uniref:NXPE family member 4-like n=1 Tax=Branchiostoma floridae TaxID=7739 RepID=A0A9J7LN03_BRAFL|nr:NXPE family member 4-like [Branchiostoma floridae]
MAQTRMSVVFAVLVAVVILLTAKFFALPRAYFGITNSWHQIELVPSPKRKLTKTPHPEIVAFPIKVSCLYNTGDKLEKVTTQSDLDQVTYPGYTDVTVLSKDNVYHRGDVLTVRVVARDKKGRPKTYGGDFFRARLVSSDRSLQASSAGHVTDHCNGTYTVQFPLYWVGGVSIKIQLVHPSEAVQVLQRTRETPNKRFFFCSFVDVKTKSTESRQCFSSPNPSLPPQQQCDFSKREVNGTWICEKPKKLPCSSISMCRFDADKSWKRAARLLSGKEIKVFQKPYLETELKVDPKEPIRVLEAELTTPQHLPACTGDARESGVTLGHWSAKVWKSSVCNVRVFAKEDIRRCLANKTVHTQGDSSQFQWCKRLTEVIPLSKTDTMGPEAKVGTPQRPPHVRVYDNDQWNISVRWQWHHYPVQITDWHYFNDFSYTADVLDSIRGGQNTVVVLGLWAHFTAEPLDMIRSRMYAIRAAIHRLKRRSPDTQVFVRTGTTREHNKGMLKYYLLGSDWMAYQITEVIREVFRADPDVVVLDTWDMSVCQPGKDHVHADQTMVNSELYRLLSHICPTN